MCRSRALDESLDEFFAFYEDFVDAGLLGLIEGETDKVTGGEVVIVEVLGKLLFTTLVIGIATSNLQFDNILMGQIVNDNIRASFITGFGFYIVITYPINNRTKIQQEQTTAFLF